MEPYSPCELGMGDTMVFTGQIHRKGDIEVNVHIEVGGEYSPPPSVRKAYTHKHAHIQ